MLQNGPKNICLWYISASFFLITLISHHSRINSLNVIFLSCLIIFGLTQQLLPPASAIEVVQTVLPVCARKRGIKQYKLDNCHQIQPNSDLSTSGLILCVSVWANKNLIIDINESYFSDFDGWCTSHLHRSCHAAVVWFQVLESFRSVDGSRAPSKLQSRRMKPES